LRWQAASGDRDHLAAGPPAPGQAGTGVLILDTKMSNFDALASPRTLAATCPDLRILILTDLDDEEHVHGLLKAGAWDYLLKEEAVMSLISAVRSVAR